MYLSKLVLNTRQSQVHRELGNAHKFHQRIMQAFPDEDTRGSRRPVQKDHRPREDWHILFRQEPDSDVVLVQSKIEPDWSQLPQGYLTKQTKKTFDPRASQLEAGRIVQFRLKANPSKRDKHTGKIIGLLHQPDQMAWLDRQASQHGFALLSANVVPTPNVFGVKAKGTAPIRIATALYQGVLQITDPDLFIKAIQQGIGRGRSYGCGLLSIAPLQH